MLIGTIPNSASRSSGPASILRTPPLRCAPRLRGLSSRQVQGEGSAVARDRIRALARVAIDIPKDTNPGARDGQGRPQDRQGQALQLQLRQRPYARGHQGDRRGFGPGGEEGREIGGASWRARVCEYV